MYNVINYVSSAVSLWSRLQFRSVVPCFSVSAAKMICCDSLWVIKFLLNLSISLTVRKVKYITYTLHFSLAELTFVVLFLSDEVRCLFQQWSVSIDVIFIILTTFSLSWYSLCSNIHAGVTFCWLLSSFWFLVAIQHKLSCQFARFHSFIIFWLSQLITTIDLLQMSLLLKHCC